MTKPIPDCFTPDHDALWAMYRNALSRAERTRESVLARLRAGLNPCLTREDGTCSAMDAIAHDEAYRAIDTYVAASKLLHEAAQTLCDCLNLDNEGKGEGVKWGVPLIERRVR